MNIAIDIRCLTEKNRTGVGEYTVGYLNNLFDADKENQYFLFYNSWQDVSDNIPRWGQNNVHYIVSKLPSKVFNFLVWLRIIKLDRFIERKFNINNLDQFFSPNINFISLTEKIRFILVIHDLSFEFFPDFYSWKRSLWHKFVNPKKLCQRAEEIITPSENTKRDVVREYKVESRKVKVIYPRISSLFDERRTANNEQVKLKYNLPDQFILFLGTLEPRKNIVSIIQAFKNSELRTKNYELIIAGAKGWKYQNILKEIDKTSGVQYVGYIDEKDKVNLYTMAKLFVFPSFYEGFGLPVLEAMSCGVSVITSNRSSLPEVISSSVTLVNPYNMSEIADGMKLILENVSLD